MKITTQYLKSSIKNSYEAFESSRVEERELADIYHGRVYTDEERRVLRQRNQPEEEFNLIRTYSNIILGYFSQVVNAVKVLAKYDENVEQALLLNDVLRHTYRDNQFLVEGEKIKLDGLLSGLMCVSLLVVETGEKDEFGRPQRRIVMRHIPSREILIDPSSKAEDYSDARFVHRFKWVSGQYLTSFIKKEKKNAKDIMAGLTPFYNYINERDADYEEHETSNVSRHDHDDPHYLLCHSVIVDENEKVKSIFWIEDIVLSEEDITDSPVRFPYRIQKLAASDRTEYYGWFRTVKGTQRAINQAILKIQLLINSKKVYVASNAVANLEEFALAVESTNAVVPVNSLDQIRVERDEAEIAGLYQIVHEGVERFKQSLGINDSLLGQAFASDSGRKVKLQREGALLALRPLTTKFEQLYKLLSWDIVKLIQHYYTAHQVFSLSDPQIGQKFVEINKPVQQFNGQLDQMGQPVFENMMFPKFTPEGEPEKNKQGEYVVEPYTNVLTELNSADIQLEIDSTLYAHDSEESYMQLNEYLQGPGGQLLAQHNIAGYFDLTAMAIRSVRTKESLNMAAILKQTAEGIRQAQQSQPPAEHPTQSTEQ